MDWHLLNVRDHESTTFLPEKNAAATVNIVVNHRLSTSPYGRESFAEVGHDISYVHIPMVTRQDHWGNIAGTAGDYKRYIMIYHYTDLNAVKSITENAEVWLTDYRYLNDKEEFSKGYEILLNALENYKNDSEKYPEKYLVDIQEAVEFISGDSFEKSERNKIFVSSFSRVPDLLNQWRSYGMYCLELDEDFFRDDDVEVLECHYIQHINDALDYAEKLIEFYILPKLLKIWQQNKHWVSVELSALIDIYALSFKHEAFSSEHEIRFVLSCSSDDNRIAFRVRGDMLIPYIPLKFDPQLLRTIWIGPVDNQDLVCESLTMFANKVSEKVKVVEGNIEYDLLVENSVVPYRNI